MDDATAECPDCKSSPASSCSRLVDSIAKTRPYVEHTAAVEAVDKIPDDQLEGAWAWTATYLVALERRISSENVKADTSK